MPKLNIAPTYQSVFERIEKKYLITPAQYEALMPRLGAAMAPDAYGRHTIQNVYFDTKDYTLLRHSIEKPIYKEKLRLRSYGIPSADDTVFVELKKKFDGIVYKRRAPMSLRQADAYLIHNRAPQSQQILREIDCFRALYPVIPRVYIAYERTAWAGLAIPELRVTFDESLRWRAAPSRDALMSLFKGDPGSPLMDEARILMEIKIPGAMPLWLSHALSDLAIFPTSFSKVGTCYARHLIHDETLQGGVFCA